MAEAPTLRGGHVTLRAPIPSDKADRLRLGRDAEIVRMFGGDTVDLAPLSQHDVDAWYNEVNGSVHAWMIEHEGRCIGSARLHSFDEQRLSARYAVGILDAGLLGRGFGSEVTRLVLVHGFDDLKASADRGRCKPISPKITPPGSSAECRRESPLYPG